MSPCAPTVRSFLRRCLPVLALASAGLAQSQPVGVYEGLTSQGQFVQLQISAGPSGGRPVLSFVQVVYDLSCSLSGRHSLEGYAVSTRVRLDSQGGFNRHLFTGRFDGRMQARYDGVQAFNGITTLYGAKLLPSLPLVAENCQAVDVPFSATRVASGARLPLSGQGLDSLTEGFWAADGSLQGQRTQTGH